MSQEAIICSVAGTDPSGEIMAKARVLICDDHALLRAGLRQLISTQEDLEVCGEASDTRQAICQAQELRPDIAVVDLTMPGGGGVLAIENIRKRSPATRVIVLTMHDDPAFARTALAAGALGYITKSSADVALLSAMRAVRQGHAYIDPLIAAAALQISSSPLGALDTRSPLERLSEREREVLLLIAQGYTNQKIADKLFISVKTAETHRARVGKKLGLKDRADFVRLAVEHDILSSEHTPAT